MTADVNALLQPLKDRLAAATLGPWRVEYDNIDDYESGISYGDFPNYLVGPRNISLTENELRKQFWQEYRNRIHEVSEMDTADAEFIAAAPTDQAKLIAAIEAVAGLHKPELRLGKPWERDYDFAGHCCTEDGQRWPCDTIAFLTQALGGDTE